MSDTGAAASDQVTVLVFKDSFSARTFQIPLRWISRLGFLLGICAGVTILMTFFGVRYYRQARQASPARVQELEMELSELRASYRQLEIKKASEAPVVNNVTPTSAPAAAAAPPEPVPTVTVTVTPAGSPAQPYLFSALPAQNAAPIPDPSTLPFKLSSPRALWQGTTFRVHFNIQYVNTDGGTQQGRIVVLARGRETLLAHPAGVLNRAGADSLINFHSGEYFSVSRFREGKADFGPLRSHDLIDDAEVLIFNQEGKLLLREVLTPEKSTEAQNTPKAKPAAKTRAKSQAKSAPADDAATPAESGTERNAPADQAPSSGAGGAENKEPDPAVAAPENPS